VCVAVRMAIDLEPCVAVCVAVRMAIDLEPCVAVCVAVRMAIDLELRCLSGYCLLTCLLQT